MQAVDPDRLQANPSSASAYSATGGKLVRLTMALFPSLRNGGNENASLTRSPSVLTELIYGMAQKRGWQAFPTQDQTSNILGFAGHTVCHDDSMRATTDDKGMRPCTNKTWQKQVAEAALGM